MKKVFVLTALLVLVVGLSYGQLGLKAVGAGAGFVSSTFSSGGASETLSGFVVGGAANLGELAPGLMLVPDVGYWSSSKDLGGGVKWSVSDFVINGNVSYRFDAGGSFIPYVGGGLGLNFVSTTIDFPAIGGFFAGGSVSDSATKLGINLFGGGAVAAGDKMQVGAQFRYVIMSEVNHLMILGTVMFTL